MKTESEERVWVNQTGCPYLNWSNYPPGWYWEIGFYLENKTACEDKRCENKQCHNWGKAFDEPSRRLGSSLRSSILVSYRER